MREAFSQEGDVGKGATMRTRGALAQWFLFLFTQAADQQKEQVLSAFVLCEKLLSHNMAAQFHLISLILFGKMQRLIL